MSRFSDLIRKFVGTAARGTSGETLDEQSARDLAAESTGQHGAPERRALPAQFLHTLDIGVLPADGQDPDRGLSEERSGGVPCLVGGSHGAFGAVPEKRLKRIFHRGGGWKSCGGFLVDRWNIPSTKELGDARGFLDIWDSALIARADIRGWLDDAIGRSAL